MNLEIEHTSKLRGRQVYKDNTWLEWYCIYYETINKVNKEQTKQQRNQGTSAPQTKLLQCSILSPISIER